MQASDLRIRSVGSSAHIAEAVIEKVWLDDHSRMASCSNEQLWATIQYGNTHVQ